MSMDAAVMDLGKAFEYGQGYVALSRVRTLDGVHLEGLNMRALEVHPHVLEVDGVFRAASNDADEQFRRMLPETESKMHHDFIRSIGGVLKGENDENRNPPKKKANETDKGVGAMVRIREKYPNAYKSWTEDDDQKLTQYFSEGVKRPQLAKMFGRNGGAIRSRLVHLGLIEG
jgi:hypothetical protein